MAFGNATFSDAGSAVSDIMGGIAKSAGLRLKAEGDEVEAENYDAAAVLAGKNEKYTEQSTAVKQTMADRDIYQGIGKEETQIAGGNFADSGSALDLLRSSASQGALQKSLVGEQGLITEAGYSEQQQSYANLAKYARVAEDADNSAASSASLMGWVTGGIAAAASIATLFTGGAAPGNSSGGGGS